MTTPTPISGLSPGDLVLSHSTYLPLRVGTPLLVLEVKPPAEVGWSPRLRVITPRGVLLTVEQHRVKLASRLPRTQEARDEP